MNDSELQQKLKVLPVPERTEEYWNDFPQSVSRQLRRPVVRVEVDERWRTRVAWQFAASAACLFVGLLVLNQPLRAASSAVVQQEIALRHELNVLPKNLRMLMAEIAAFGQTAHVEVAMPLSIPKLRPMSANNFRRIPMVLDTPAVHDRAPFRELFPHRCRLFPFFAVSSDFSIAPQLGYHDA